ncbi:MAG: exo-alpha-sialidase [Proteobacteria bacterium]|nr:exo-alpha-sialidase [Pseudomonadota bacterium]
MTSIKDIEHVRVYKDPDGEHACNQVSMVLLRNGDLLLGFNEERYPIHADSGQSCYIVSKDGGKIWDRSTKQVVWPYSDHKGNFDCAFSQSTDGTILMHTRVCSFLGPRGINSEGDQLLEMPPPGMPERLKRQTGYAILKSGDNGATWTEPIDVNTSPIASSSLSWYACGGSGAGQIIELPDGGLLMPLGGTISVVEEPGTGPEPERCFMLRSDDGGDNWEYWSTIAYDAASIINFTEPGVTRLENGNLVCLLRVQHRPKRQDNMWFTWSDDDGVTWKPPRRTPLWGYPADVMQLKDGRVLAVYSYRKDDWGIRGCVSEDGMIWDIANEFVIRKGGAAALTEKSDPTSIWNGLTMAQYWHTGYPSMTQLADETIVVAYHEYSKEDQPIHYLMSTRFKL